MPRFASTIIVAGINWSGCRGILINSEEFADSMKGSINWAQDATPWPDMIDTLYKGAQFGLDLGQDGAGLSKTKINQMINAIKTQRNTQGYFPVVVVDEQYSVDLKCIQDFTQQWFVSGKYSEGFIEGVKLRFVVREANSVALSA